MSGWGGKYPVTERSTECPTDALSQLSAFRCRSSQKVGHLPPWKTAPRISAPRTNAPNFSKHGANAYTFVQGGRCPGGGLMSVHRPATPCERGFPAAQIPLIGLTSFVSADLTVQPWQETCSTFFHSAAAALRRCSTQFHRTTTSSTPPHLRHCHVHSHNSEFQNTTHCIHYSC